MTTTTTRTRLACALLVLPPLLLLLAAPPSSASDAAAPAHNNNAAAPYDCTLRSAPDSWKLECSEEGACKVRLPANSFPSSAARVTCVVAFSSAADTPDGIFGSYSALLAARSTPLAPVQEECERDGPSQCSQLSAQQVRTRTAKVTPAARKKGLTISFSPKVYVPSSVSAESPTPGYVACAQLPKTKRHRGNAGQVCSEEPDVQVHTESVDGCLPGDATVRRVVAGAESTGEIKLESARVADLRLGDEVECVAPLGEGTVLGSSNPSDWADAATDWKPTTCRVYYYLDASAKESRFVTLHYSSSSEDGSKQQTFRATREHLAFVASAAVPVDASSPAPPRGLAKRMDSVAVGDLLAVRSADGKSFYTAAVTAVTYDAVAPGAYAPLLTKAGLLVADGAVVFPHVHLLRSTPVHPMTNLGEHYRHGRIWTEFENIVASGCQGDACPCLDARRPDGFCAKVGMRLADLPDGVSTFAARSLALMRAAIAEGRTEFGYEAALRAAPLIRGYLHATTRWPLLRHLFAPTNGPAGEVTHRVANHMMRVPRPVVVA
jgi:hypothetical protein